jgi:hypothetical protein
MLLAAAGFEVILISRGIKFPRKRAVKVDCLRLSKITKKDCDKNQLGTLWALN